MLTATAIVGSSVFFYPVQWSETEPILSINYSGGHDTYDSSAIQGIVSDMTVDGYPSLKTGYTDNPPGVQVNTDKSLAAQGTSVLCFR